MQKMPHGDGRKNAQLEAVERFDPSKYKDSEAAWLAFRKLWLAANPPLDNGYMICAICGDWVRASEVTLDHIEPRTAENIYRSDNIQPAHGACNYNKGSRRLKPKVNKETYEFLSFLSDI